MTLSTFYLAFCLFVCNGNLYPFSNNVKLNNKSSSSSNATVEFLLDYLSIKYPDVNFEEIIYVGIKRQELYYIKKGQLVKSYHISSSADGAGNVFGSNKTPIGLHKIQKKISVIFTLKRADISLNTAISIPNRLVIYNLF